jgi:Tfp pilus assembly protein PilN
MKAVNLLPPDQRGASKATAVSAVATSGGTGALAVLGALAIGVVAVAGYVLTTNTIKERQAQLDGLAAREQAAMAKVGDLKPYADFAQLASTRVATVKDLAGRRFDWENALRDLSRVIPSNVTLNSLSGTVSTDSGGTGGSSLRGAINVPAISITGCTRNQRDVAVLMARLRTVDGVTRVSLAKSEKKDVAAASAAAGPTPSVAGNGSTGCGVGSPPDFEMVMFFERAGDAAAAPTGAAGTATQTAATQASGAAATASGTSPTGTATTPANAAASTTGTTTPTSTTTSTGATAR